MRTIERLAVRAAVGLLCGTALGALAIPGGARAETFQLGDGWEATTSLDLSVGAAMRVRSPDAGQVTRGNGGTGDGTTTDDGNLNFDKGELYSLIGKALGELEVSRDGYGVFLRGKAWYDAVTDRRGVPHGHSANGYVSGAELDDSDFDSLSKFKGVALLDAYAFGTFDVGDTTTVGIKAGNHVVNWGESLFVSGVSQYNIIDAAAARRPGAQLKEILLPVPQISANVGFGGGFSAEAFYQLAWKHSIIEGCGTFWSPSDTLNCSDTAVNLAPSPFGDRQGYYGIPALGGLNARMSNAGDEDARDSGQFGLAARYFDSDLGTDFGLYYVQYHPRMPIFSLEKTPSARGSLYSLPTRSARYFADYSAEDIRVVGASVSTAVDGWSVGGELSHTFDYPVQINTSDLVGGLVSGVGPLAYLNRLPAGTVVHGYDRKDKTQFQVSTIKSFANVLGSDRLSFIGEAAFQYWHGIDDPNTGVRYGRSPLYGRAGSATTACGTTVADYCDASGFATSFAWGLRTKFAMTYSDVFAGVNLTPSLSIAWDVSGMSADGTFVEDRVNVGLGLRADLLQRYYADLTYSTYNHAAKYDAYSDHDFVALVIGMTF